MPRAAPLLAALALMLAGCAPPIRAPVPQPAPTTAQGPADFPRGDYARAAAQGQPVYRIDPARSLIAITVRRGGSLARLGHDHIIASHQAQGYIAPEQGRADLYVPLAELSVDEPALRAEAGLDTQPSDADIAGTRTNMRDRVLETQRFPFALIRVNGVEKMPAGARLDAAITLHGTTRSFQVPVRMETAAGEMSVAGSIEFKQSDFGITPLSILGGSIQVQDGLSLRFSIRAVRDASAP